MKGGEARRIGGATGDRERVQRRRGAHAAGESTAEELRRTEGYGGAKTPGPEREWPRKPRGEWTILTANVATWKAHSEEVMGLRADVVALQEHRIPEERKREARAAAARAGYRLWLGDAPTKGSDNTIYAGTAVLTRADLPAYPLAQGEGAQQGRWSSVRIGGGLKGGAVTVVSVYGHVTEGMRDRNKELLREVG